MNVAKIELDKSKADALYRAYKAHRGAHTKEDAEIERIYYQISRGRKVIRALESIRAAGVDEKGFPRLALIRADTKLCRASVFCNGEVTFGDSNKAFSDRTAVKVKWPEFKGIARTGLQGIVPMIPVHLRPQASDLYKYHILWEADWTAVPVDPMLLRKIGGDAWLVVAAWDLTAVEQAVLAGRMTA